MGKRASIKNVSLLNLVNVDQFQGRKRREGHSMKELFLKMNQFKVIQSTIDCFRIEVLYRFLKTTDESRLLHQKSF
jgi:hypothetical protein